MEHTVCGLTIHQKIRLCTIVLNAEQYRQEVRFLPHEDNIVQKCARRAVRFSYEPDDLTWDYNVNKDWLVGCRAVTIKNNEQVIYYVSAGIQVYEHFICVSPSLKDTLLSGVKCRIRVKKLQNEYG